MVPSDELANAVDYFVHLLSRSGQGQFSKCRQGLLPEIEKAR